MGFNDIDYSGLPKSREAALVAFVDIVNETYASDMAADRRANTDQHDNYYGSYAPERSYVTTILAFIDEYEVDLDVIDISDLPNGQFFTEFGRFKSKIDYVRTRFKLRQAKGDAGGIGTTIAIASSYKSEIGHLLETIRKIINQEPIDTKKKDKIFSKISSLQSEVDRDRTTVDAVFSRMLDLSQAVGESAEKLDPLIKQLERLKKLLWDSSEKIDLLPKPERPKMIAKEETNVGTLDDEIPF